GIWQLRRRGIVHVEVQEHSYSECEDDRPVSRHLPPCHYGASSPRNRANARSGTGSPDRLRSSRTRSRVRVATNCHPVRLPSGFLSGGASWAQTKTSSTAWRASL